MGGDRGDLLAAIGSLLVAPIGRRAGMPVGWAWLAPVTALLALAAAVLHVLHAFPIDWSVLLVAAGVVVPIWAIWIALRAEAIAPPAELV